jgi:hypothetical protein
MPIRCSRIQKHRDLKNRSTDKQKKTKAQLYWAHLCVPKIIKAGEQNDLFKEINNIQ